MRTGHLELIAKASEGVDVVAPVEIGLKLPPQPLDVHVNRLRGPCEVVPGELRELVPAEYPAGVFHQRIKQRELPLGQADRMLVHERLGLREVEGDLADRNILVNPAATPVQVGAPQQGGDPSEQVARREGLDDIVVGSRQQRPDNLILLPALREHQQWRIRIDLPHLLADSDAVMPGQHRFHYDQVDQLRLKQVQRRLRLGRGMHLVSLLPEQMTQDLELEGVFVNRQDSRQWPPPYSVPADPRRNRRP